MTLPIINSNGNDYTNDFSFVDTDGQEYNYRFDTVHGVFNVNQSMSAFDTTSYLPYNYELNGQIINPSMIIGYRNTTNDYIVYIGVRDSGVSCPIQLTNAREYDSYSYVNNWSAHRDSLPSEQDYSGASKVIAIKTDINSSPKSYSSSDILWQTNFTPCDFMAMGPTGVIYCTGNSHPFYSDKEIINDGGTGIDKYVSSHSGFVTALNSDTGSFYGLMILMVRRDYSMIHHGIIIKDWRQGQSFNLVQ